MKTNCESCGRLILCINDGRVTYDYMANGDADKHWYVKDGRVCEIDEEVERSRA